MKICRRSKSLSAFEDDFTPQATPHFIITLNNDSTTVATVQAWKMPDEKWVLTSSLQENVYFSSGGSSLIDDLFIFTKQ